MDFKNSMTKGVPSDDKINKKYKNLLDDYLNAMDSDGEDLDDISHDKPYTSDNKTTNGMMTWTQMLEAMDDISDSMDSPSDDIMDSEIDDSSSDDDKETVEELNKLFTPVLVTQSLEKDIVDKQNSELSESGLLTERNIMKFDDETKMAQLINVCARLIAKKKNTPAWQMYAKASGIKKKASLDIQKEEGEKAKELAQKYLVYVSTTNKSSVARKAATDLLPQTNKQM